MSAAHKILTFLYYKYCLNVNDITLMLFASDIQQMFMEYGFIFCKLPVKPQFWASRQAKTLIRVSEYFHILKVTQFKMHSAPGIIRPYDKFSR